MSQEFKPASKVEIIANQSEQSDADTNAVSSVVSDHEADEQALAAAETHEPDASPTLDACVRETPKPQSEDPLRNWPGALLAFVTLNTYLLLYTQVDRLVFAAGANAWTTVTKFSALALGTLLTSGLGGLWAYWQNAGAFQIFYGALLVYGCLFIVYPLAIFAPARGGRIFASDASSKQQKLAETIAVLLGLAAFVPIPACRLFRSIFWIRWRKWRGTKAKTPAEEQPVTQQHSFWHLLPEGLALACELMLTVSVVYCVLINLMVGSLRLNYADWTDGFWIMIPGELFWALIITLVMRRDESKRKQW